MIEEKLTIVSERYRANSKRLQKSGNEADAVVALIYLSISNALREVANELTEGKEAL